MTIKVAVISDVHAASPRNGAVASYTSTSPSGAPDNRDAMMSLYNLIAHEKLQADYLVCCGDMANQAEPVAMEYVWGKFSDLASKLNAKPMATVGNHDLDSRLPETKFDARGLLRGLQPPYPILDINKTHEFWSRNFTVLEYPGIRFVVLNSCAYHGYNPEKSGPEYIHGRISDYTLSDLKKLIGTLPEDRTINTLICHHHPYRYQGDSNPDASTMIGGDLLIDLLASAMSNTWLIFHGHRHQPQLSHWGGSGRGPIIFGAGSFSAKLSSDIGMKARNQFYIVEFDAERAKNLQIDVAGSISAWDFNFSEGWEPAGTKSGLPARSGFGYQLNVVSDAIKVAASVANSGGIARWSDVIGAEPQLWHVTPSSLLTLAKELKDHHNIGCTWSDRGDPLEFAKFK
ncbi:MAG: hypothetical protein OJF61_001303 [Rhodanobacteraceae bacterium]|jgi:predicted phosphodiesterase|nr:MAG: hypothetical protein OJF61_001303 [Rhodanobacteraceae bacterium]